MNTKYMFILGVVLVVTGIVLNIVVRRHEATSHVLASTWILEDLSVYPLSIVPLKNNRYALDWYADTGDQAIRFSGTVRMQDQDTFVGKVDLVAGTMKTTVKTPIALIYQTSTDTVDIHLDNPDMTPLYFTRVH